VLVASYIIEEKFLD